jgi:hypothetical protein
MKAVWATQADQLDPQQWVSVYQINPAFVPECEFYGACQVKALDSLLNGEDPEYFGLVLLEDEVRVGA